MATIKSIEEKAKSFKEALSRAKGFYKRFPEYKEILEKIFPELKENEDERIRGNIIATIHLYYGEPLEDEAKEMIAWLERRGQTFNKKDIDDAYLKGVCDAKHELEKQGEQNVLQTPTREMILAVWELGHIWKGLTHGVCSTEHGTQLDYIQKHWKESDYYLDAKHDELILANSAKTCKDEQKPAWSEEDEMIALSIEQVMNCASLLNIVPEKIDKIRTWLKSLKDRYTWKPSDEQMDALHYVTNFDYGGHKSTLVSLYEQLKKLK